MNRQAYNPPSTDLIPFFDKETIDKFISKCVFVSEPNVNVYGENDLLRSQLHEKIIIDTGTIIGQKKIQLVFGDNNNLNNSFGFYNFNPLWCNVFLRTWQDSDIIEIPTNTGAIEKIFSDFIIDMENKKEVHNFLLQNAEMINTVLEANSKVKKYFQKFSLELNVHQDVDGESTLWIFILNDLSPAKAIDKEMKLFREWFKEKYIKFKSKIALCQVHKDGL